jgi:hypothetical protein
MASQRQSVVRFGGKSEESAFPEVVTKNVSRNVLERLGKSGNPNE